MKSFDCFMQGVLSVFYLAPSAVPVLHTQSLHVPERTAPANDWKQIGGDMMLASTQTAQVLKSQQTQLKFDL